MRGHAVKKFFRDQHFFSSYVSRGLARAQFCIDGTAGPLLGRAFAVNPRSPQGRAGRREGLTAKARAELQWSPGQYAANVTAFSVDPSFLVDVPITFVQLTPRRSPFRYAALATSPYIRSGRSPYQDPSCSSARAQGSKVGWDPSKPRHIAARVFADHTSTLESVMFLLSSLSVSLITPSEQRLQAPDLSRDSARAQSAACVRRRRS